MAHARETKVQPRKTNSLVHRQAWQEARPKSTMAAQADNQKDVGRIMNPNGKRLVSDQKGPPESGYPAIGSRNESRSGLFVRRTIIAALFVGLIGPALAADPEKIGD